MLELVVDQGKQPVVLAPEEKKEEGLFVHEVLEEDLKAELGRQILFLRLQHAEEIVFQELLLLG